MFSKKIARFLFLALLSLSFSACSQTIAELPKNSIDSQTVALGGYDAMELSDGDLVLGDAKYYHTHNKKVYYFKNEDNVKSFYKEKDKFLSLADKQWELINNNAIEESK